MQKRRITREDASEPTGGNVNTLVIAAISLALLGGVGAMLYSISPETFNFGPKSAAAHIPELNPAPQMPDLSALVNRIPEAPVPTTPAKVRQSARPQPQSEVLANVKKWTGLGGWKGMTTKTDSSPTPQPTSEKKSALLRK